MSWDQDVGIPTARERDDGDWMRSDEGNRCREIGELLLRVDELEDTLRIMESQPTGRAEPGPGGRYEAMRRLEQRIQADRARIEALERRGAIQYDQIERAIRLTDAMG